VIRGVDIGLARPDDAPRIACMSRDLIEHGLDWRWTPARVLRLVHHHSTNVAVAREGARIDGFGIMLYRDEDAHLMLFAVDPRRRRSGIGRALMGWLEETALTAGIGVVRLEARASNHAARTFYRQLGYVEAMHVRGMYAHDEDGVRFAKDLWACA
jgi:[ribosomal protein S18]-alanine N-acetyltransferase